MSREFARFQIAISDLEKVLGWSLQSESLGKGTICIPIRGFEDVTNGLRIELVEFARLTNQNVVFDTKFGIAALGESALICGNHRSDSSK